MFCFLFRRIQLGNSCHVSSHNGRQLEVSCWLLVRLLKSRVTDFGNEGYLLLNVYLVLEGKLEFSSIRFWYFVYIRCTKESWVVYISTLLLSIVINVRLWATFPHAYTRATFGWRTPTTCGHECSPVQGVLGPAIFWNSFFSGADSELLGEVTRASGDAVWFPRT